MFAAVRFWAPGAGDVGSRVAALVLSFIVAWGSMQLVEAPGRRWILGRTPPPRPLDVTDRVDLCDGSADDGEVVVHDVERIRSLG